jgi:hypothetical protein
MRNFPGLDAGRKSLRSLGGGNMGMFQTNPSMFRQLIISLVVSSGIVSAQTPAADRASAAFKVEKDKLTAKFDAEMAKKAGDKEKVKKIYRQETEKLEAQYLPVMFTEIGLAQKAGDKAKEEALKLTLEKVFEDAIGEVLMGGKVLDVSCAGLTKIGSLAQGSKIQLQYICGTWNVYPTSPMVKPDTTDTPQCNIKLLHKAISGERTTIASNIKHTREKPFEHTVEITGSYFLEISGTVGNAHAGKTVYRVVTEKE